MNNEPVAWLLFRDGGESYPEYTTSYKQMREWETYLGDNERIEPHYTHPAKNNGGNPEELNTRQIQDARTSLESTPPFAYAVYVGEDDRQNIFLQFDHPKMCGQKYKKATPLYTHPAKTLSIGEIHAVWAAGKYYELDKDGQVDVINFTEFARAILRKAQEKL